MWITACFFLNFFPRVEIERSSCLRMNSCSFWYSFYFFDRGPKYCIYYYQLTCLNLFRFWDHFLQAEDLNFNCPTSTCTSKNMTLFRLLTSGLEVSIMRELLSVREESGVFSSFNVNHLGLLID